MPKRYGRPSFCQKGSLELSRIANLPFTTVEKILIVLVTMPIHRYEAAGSVVEHHAATFNLDDQKAMLRVTNEKSTSVTRVIRGVYIRPE